MEKRNGFCLCVGNQQHINRRMTKMIKLGDLLKVIELDGPNLKVYTKVSPYESRQIHPSLLPNYYTREVTVNVTIEGPLLKEDK